MATPTTLRTRAAGAVVLLCAAAVGVPASGQENCDFVEGTGTLRSITLAGGARITNVGTPHLRCADGVEIWADSAVSFSAQGMTDLMGSVRFRDPGRELRSRSARYFSSTGRLQASGDVFLEDRVRGSVIRNGDLVYLHVTEFREQEQITVTTAADRIRPQATLHMRAAQAPAAASPDSAAVDTLGGAAPRPLAAPAAPAAAEGGPAGSPDASATPYEVVGDRLFVVGDGFFRAIGRVEIDRDSLHATADSAEYDQVAGRLLLSSQATVRGASYDLSGRAIDVLIPGGEVSEVVARRNGVLTGDDLRLDAPLIHLFLEAGLMDRLVATPLRTDEPLLDAQDSLVLARPVALAESFRLEADSIDVRAPHQLLERIHAVGSARGESSARDSLNVEALPEIARRDWLEGDTVIATFVPAVADTAKIPPAAPPPDAVTLPAPSGAPPAPDTAEAGYTLDRLVASGRARTLYRLLPADTTARPGTDPPAVHYVTGDRITIHMVEGEVTDMEVEGPTRGYHLEPLPLAVVADSLGAGTATVPDSLAVPDSAAARPDTGRVGSGAVPASPAPRRPPAGGSRDAGGHDDPAARTERGRTR